LKPTRSEVNFPLASCFARRKWLYLTHVNLQNCDDIFVKAYKYVGADDL